MNKENTDTIQINGKTIAVIFILLILLFSAFSFYFIKSSNNAQVSDSGDIPEKCRPPTGQDIGSWKEHLGHHADTQDCLRYFD